MNTREEYIRKMQAKLEEWNADIDILSAKASEVSADVRSEYNEQIAALKAKQAVARQKIEEVQKSGESAWKDLKATEFNPNTAIPSKYKNLIGLAVAAQIPSAYLVYYSTQAAILNGATKEELTETAAMAGNIRAWSTVLNGQMVDESKFHGEVGQIMKHLKSKMGKEVGRVN